MNLEMTGDGAFALKLGETTLYKFFIRVRKSEHRTVSKNAAVDVWSCRGLQTNISQYWKYSWYCSLEDALEVLEPCDTTEFVAEARRKGWK